MHTPDQIEAWARASGLFIGFDGNVYTKEPIDGIAFSELATFAALVAQHERERCAQIADRESTGNMADGQIIAAAIRNSDGG